MCNQEVMEDQKKRMIDELNSTLKSKISENKLASDKKNEPACGIIVSSSNVRNDGHDDERADQVSSWNNPQVAVDDGVLMKFRRLSLNSGKNESVYDGKFGIGKFRRRTYSVTQQERENVSDSVVANKTLPSSVAAKKFGPDSEIEAMASLRGSLLSSLRKVKDKLHERRSVLVFKTYLGPEIVITDEEHQKAEDRFNICIQQQQIFDSDEGGVHHFRIISYTKCLFTIHHFRSTRTKEETGRLSYLVSDPLTVFTEAKVRLKIHLNAKNPEDDVTRCLALGLCMDEDAPNWEGNRTIGVRTPTRNFYHKRTIRVCNRLEPSGARDITFEDEPPFGTKWTRQWLRHRYFDPKLVSHQLLEREAGFLQLCDELQIQVIFEPLFPLIKFYESNNGILNWTLTDYAYKRQAEKEGFAECWYSPYFYSEPHGYRMRARLYLNGTGIAKGHMVSVFLDFLVGEWDGRLPTLDSFPHQTTVTICNQSEMGGVEGRSLFKTEISRDGCPSDFWYDFAKQVDIREDVHLKRNELLIRIEVKPLWDQKADVP